MASLWFTLRELTQVPFLSTHTHLQQSVLGRLNIQPGGRTIHKASNAHSALHKSLPSVTYPAIPCSIPQHHTICFLRKWKHIHTMQRWNRKFISKKEVFLLSQEILTIEKGGVAFCEICKYSIEWEGHIPLSRKYSKGAKLPWPQTFLMFWWQYSQAGAS